MIVEFPQADSCCGLLSLRIGIIIVIVIRVILLACLILFWTNVFPVRGDMARKEKATHEYYEKEVKRVSTTELVLSVVTVTFIVLWLLVMTPAVIWEILSLTLIGAVLEILIWFWFFFIMAFQVSMSVIGGYMSFMLIYSIVWLVIECYILWLEWSYYVDLKTELRRDSGDYRASNDTTSTY